MSFLLEARVYAFVGDSAFLLEIRLMCLAPRRGKRERMVCVVFLVRNAFSVGGYKTKFLLVCLSGPWWVVLSSTWNRVLANSLCFLNPPLFMGSYLNVAE